MNNPTRVSKLAAQFIQKNDPTGWFEELYSQAEGNSEFIPWAESIVNPHLASWLDGHNLEGKGQKALVVGCGLGDDAEALSDVGFQVTGFDVSPTAVAWCKQRFQNTSVDYVVSDALQPEAAWKNSFDFILESYTLQALPESFRQQIMSTIVNYLTPGGMLLIICRGRGIQEDAGVSPPWALTKEELFFLEKLGLKQVSFEDYLDDNNPPVRRFRIKYLKVKGQGAGIKE
ncbi:Thiopurine S-methyltransferase [Hyella patelloides LEGE 07179]|uniref:Thiopurine S-methyltransferase n=1 Tax=Hyella patelloides LEGE 07179 TaxID=945734 RepID=A0A563VMW9_9CYAN|nr:class I SAM-dependent methyltransferase [Hyella patelloides]VEP12768.1 Thiopurine S-methyltransferase [Hyella patelloides LEGE 07179]